MKITKISILLIAFILIVASVNVSFVSFALAEQVESESNVDVGVSADETDHSENRPTNNIQLDKNQDKDKHSNKKPNEKTGYLIVYKKNNKNKNSSIQVNESESITTSANKKIHKEKLTESEAEALRNDSSVEFMEPDFAVTMTEEGVPTQTSESDVYRNPTGQTTSWGNYSIGGDIAHQSSYYGEGVKIAVLDTGIAQHPDLHLAGGVSFVDGEPDYYDNNGHGTHVAGIIGGQMNDVGVVGIAPKAELYSVKVLDSSGNGSYSQVIEGIEWAIANQINIISISFGGNNYSQILQDAIKRASDAGILIVASAGNAGAGLETETYPALYAEVVSVGAIDKSFERAAFSSTGNEIDVVAPGSGILSTTIDGAYGTSSGTSASAPFVTGTLALLWSQNPQLSVVELKQRMYTTSTSIGDSKEYGYGLINAARALGLIQVPIPPVFYGTEGYNEWVPPVFNAGGDVSITATDITGAEQTVYRGDRVNVSLIISEAKTKVYIGVFNPAGDKITGREDTNVSAGTRVEFHWTTSASTPPGTYRIKYAYSDTTIVNWFTIHVVEPPNSNTPPDQPGGFMYSSSYNSIFLSWNGVPGADEYQVKLINTGQVFVTSTPYYNVTDLVPNTAYNIEVAAINDSGSSGFVRVSPVPQTGAVAAPTGLEIQGTTSNAITLKWNKIGNGAQYIVRRGPYEKPVSGNSFTFTGLEPNTQYELEVAAEILGQRSGFASIRKSTLPDQLSGLVASGVTETSMNIDWNNIPNVSYSISVNGAYKTTVTDNHYNLAGLLPNTLYEIKVAAKSASGDLGEYAAVSKRTLADTTDPSVNLIISSNAPYIQGEQMNFVFSATDNIEVASKSFMVERDGVTLFNIDASTSNQYTYKPLSTGRYKFFLKAVDSSGNDAIAVKEVLVDKVRNVVVYIPGFLNSEILEDGDKVWPTDKLWTITHNPLALNSDGTPKYNTTVGKVFEVFNSAAGPLDFGKDLFDGLRDRDGVEFVEVAYDWRRDLSLTYPIVKAKVEEAYAIANGQKVTILTHSMGGLVARYYLSKDSNASSKVKSFINMGSPTLGTANAIKGLTEGDDLGVIQYGFFPFTLKEARNMVQNFPAVYQLLPGKKYVDAYDGIYGGKFKTFFQYSVYENIYDDQKVFNDYPSTVNFIKSQTNSSIYEVPEDASSFRYVVENSNIDPLIKEYRVVGYDKERQTLIKLTRYYAPAAIHPSYKPIWGLGDTVVPLLSANFNEKGSSTNYYLDNSSHMQLLTVPYDENNVPKPEYDKTYEILKSIIVDKAPISTSAYPKPSLTDIKGTAIDILCPVNVRLRDANGNEAYVNEDGFVINNIPGLTYEIIGESKLLFVNEGTTVTIFIDGYDEGELNVGFTKYENSMPGGTNVLQHVAIQDGAKLQFNFTGTITDPATLPIQYDYDNDGQFDTINPGRFLSYEHYMDFIAPMTETVVSGQQTKGWYNTPVTIQLSASDTDSGVDKTYYQLDGGTKTEYVEPIYIAVEGIHTITYYSMDKSGNSERAKSMQIKLDMGAPTVPTLTLDRTAYKWSGSGLHWGVEDANLTVSGGTDSVSGPVTLQYRIGETGNWVNYVAPTPLHFDAITGPVNIYARAVDGAGNVSNSSIKTFTAIRLSGSSCCGIDLEGYNTVPDSGHSAYTYVSIQNVIWYKEGIYYDYTVRYSDGSTSTNAGGKSKADLEKVEKKWDSQAPTVPGNFTLTNKTNISAKVSWSASTDDVKLAGYNVYVGGGLAGFSPTPGYTVTGLSPNNLYSVTVRAVDDTGNLSDSSSMLTFRTTSNFDGPSIPSELSASMQTDGSLGLQWKATTDNTGILEYQVFNNGVSVGTSPDTSFKLTNVQPNTTYRLSVKAVDVDGNISVAASNVFVFTTGSDVLPPSAPSNLAVRTVANKSIELTWAFSSDNIGVTKYVIFQNGVPIGSTDKLVYTASNLNPNTSYTFVVKAEDAAGLQSPASNSVDQLTTSADITSLEVVWYPFGFNISWQAVNGATSYDVEINGTSISTTSTSYYKQNQPTNTSYSVRVRPRSAGGIGAWSDLLVGKTQLKQPIIGAFVDLATKDQVTVGWSSIEGATKYELEVDGTVVETIDIRYVHTGLAPHSDHTYRVRAISADNDSPWSNVQTAATAPEKVTGVTVTSDSSTTLTITWPVVEGATRYRVEVDGTVVDSYTNSYTKTMLMATSSHTIRVLATKYNGGYNYAGEWSDPVTATTLLSTPAQIIGTPSSSTISLSWYEVSKATEYEVEADGQVISVVANPTYQYAAYVHAGLAPNSTHSYRIRAKNPTNQSAWSDVRTFTTAIGVTSSVNIVPTSSSLAITWPAVTSATGYEVEMNGTVVTSTSASYKKTGLPANTEYKIRVRAKNSGSTSDWSPLITIKTLLPTPTLTIGASTVSQISMSWAAIAGAMKYEIEADGVSLGEVTGLNYTHTGLLPSSSHTYRVRAKTDDNNTSAWSTAVSKYSTPAVVTGLNVVPTNATLVITWPAVTGATGYDVEINGTATANTTTSLTKSSLPADTHYTIRVRAKNSGGNGDWSAPVTTKTLLTTPTVTAVSGSSQIVLNWAAISGATEYEVEVDGVAVSAGAGTSYVYAGLTPNTSHTYKVRAKNAGNASAWTAVVSKYTAPAGATGVSVVPTSSSLAISWTAVTGATGYDVEINGTVTANTTTSLTKSSLPANTDYTIRVRAKNSGGSGEWSAPVTTKTYLTTPTVTAVSSSSQIALSWTAIPGAVEYEIEFDGAIVNVGADTTYTYSSLIPNTSHMYKVRALNAANSSTWTAAVSKYTTPIVTTGVNAVPASNTITISWTAVAGATGYDVEINGSAVNSTATSYAPSGLTSNTDYTIRVRAKNTGGAGEWSAPITKKTLLTTPTVSAISTSDQITLNWATIAGATEYDVEVDGIVTSNGTSTTYVHAGLSPSTSHTYRVRSTTTNNSSAWSAAVSKFTTPSVTSSVSAAPTSSSLVITWTAVTGATGYDVEVNGSAVSSTTTSYTKSGLAANTKYSVRVRAKNSGGAGEWSDAVTAITQLTTPTVTAVSTDSQISLSWVAIAEAAEYEIEVDGFVSVVTNTTFVYAGLMPSTSHTYRVRALNASNSSVWSAVTSKYTTPAEVTGISALPTSTSLSISWPAVTGATGYDVEINGVIASNTSKSYNKSGLTANTDYVIRVRAKNSGGTGTWSAPITAKTQLATPTVTAVSTSNQLTLSWVAIAGATEYEVEVDGIAVSAGTSPLYVSTGLLPSTSHTYRVRALSAGNNSAWTAAASKYTTPAEVTGVNTVPSSSSLVINWTAVSGSTGYDVEINGAFVSVTTTSYTKSSLPANTDYTIRVRAKNSGGIGDWSAPVNVKTLLTTLTATAVATSGQITLSWSVVTGATGYEVEVDGVVISNGVDTTYAHTGLILGTSHTYRVRAITMDNSSSWSAVITKSAL